MLWSLLCRWLKPRRRQQFTAALFTYGGRKIADELGVTVDYLIGGSGKIVLDKKLIKRIEDIEALPTEEKDKVYYFIDMALSHHKAKIAFAK